MKSVPVRTFYLQMRQAPPGAEPPAPAGVVIGRCFRPSLQHYRALYSAVGRDWGWIDRTLMPDAQLLELLHHPSVEVHILTVDGVEAGFSELDRRVPDEVELAYLGLMPSFTGQGLGKYLLRWTLARAWATHPHRVWLHTCEWDHPAALPFYLQAGFTLYDQKMIQQPIPGGVQAPKRDRPAQ